MTELEFFFFCHTWDTKRNCLEFHFRYEIGLNRFINLSLQFLGKMCSSNFYCARNSLDILCTNHNNKCIIFAKQPNTALQLTWSVEDMFLNLALQPCSFEKGMKNLRFADFWYKTHWPAYVYTCKIIMTKTFFGCTIFHSWYISIVELENCK